MIFEYQIDNVPRSNWVLNDGELMYQNLFEIVEDNIKRTMTYVKDPVACIQAGGAYGLWPYLYSLYFNKVYTFEAHPMNYKCLVENTKELQNIRRYPFALASEDGTVAVKYDKKHLNSYGAHYTTQGNDVHSKAIDTMGFGRVDLIQLDIEGNEINVLQGAVDTIDRNLPVIVIEDRFLPQMRKLGTKPGDAVNWLKTKFGYKVVDEFHSDKVLICE